MSTAVPSLKQSLGAIIGRRFPWLLHLAGGPDDPAVVRVGDAGTAGTVEVTGGTSLKFTNAAGETWVVPIVLSGGAVVVGPSVPPTPFNLATKSTAGSDRVTCG